VGWALPFLYTICTREYTGGKGTPAFLHIELVAEKKLEIPELFTQNMETNLQ
jgi:hypothetical protein